MAYRTCMSLLLIVHKYLMLLINKRSLLILIWSIPSFPAPRQPATASAVVGYPHLRDRWVLLCWNCSSCPGTAAIQRYAWFCARSVGDIIPAVVTNTSCSCPTPRESLMLPSTVPGRQHTDRGEENGACWLCPNVPLCLTLEQLLIPARSPVQGYL